MKVGDSIINEAPLSIPIQGMDPVMAIIKTYGILKEIKGNIAMFEFDQGVNLDPIWGQNTTTLIGSGKGKSEYDIKENQVTKYTSELPMELTIEINETMTAIIKISMHHDQDVTIN